MLQIKEISLLENNDWDSLILKSSTASFFQTREWLSLWVKHFGSEEEVRIWEIRERGKIIGIVPLIVQENKISLLGTTPVLGGELVSDFGDIIAKTSFERTIWQAVFDKLKAQSSKLKAEFNFIRENSPSFEALKKLGGKAEKVDIAPYLDLPQSWDEYLLTLNRHDRHELRRKMRRIKEQKAFQICYQGNKADVERFFYLMELSSDRKRAFLKSEMKSFFRDIFEVFWPQKMSALCFLKLEEATIASALTFFYKDEVLLYNSGFDPKFARFSPGLVLKAFLIKHAIEQKKKRFDFLRGGEKYKYDLGAKERRLYRIIFNF